MLHFRKRKEKKEQRKKEMKQFKRQEKDNLATEIIH
jgi:hypothetical protein